MSNTIGTVDSGGGSIGDVDSGGGDSGGGGIVSASGTGPTALRPIGVSPALAFVGAEDWYRGHKWPPGGLAWPNMPAGIEFPRWGWSAFHHSLVVLSEFVGYAPQNEGEPLAWNAALATANPFANNDNPADAELAASDHYEAVLERNGRAANPVQSRDQMLAAEIGELVTLAEYRPGVMAEALAQRNDIIGYFRGVLSFNRASHPATFGLAWAAMTVGQFQAMHYKSIFRRPRPSQLSPALMPPIDPPGHASYPSGHATEAYLIALCLEQVMPAAIALPAPVGGGAAPAAADRPLRRMADRIARNREALGVHYRSDSEVGRKLAENSLPILLGCPSLATAGTGLLAVARAEWGAQAA